jgi:hypothetical protein
VNEPLRFPSKVDWWIPWLIAIPAVAGPVSLYFNPGRKPLTPATVWTVAASVILPIVFLGWIFATTDYLIADGGLRVRCGPMEVTMPLDSIKRIANSTSMASGAALSLSRIAVEYGDSKEVIISPADRQGFIRAIVARVPNVVIEDLDEYR